jgi:hypothetical protein
LPGSAVAHAVRGNGPERSVLQLDQRNNRNPESSERDKMTGIESDHVIGICREGQFGKNLLVGVSDKWARAARNPNARSFCQKVSDERIDHLRRDSLPQKDFFVF